MGKLIFCYWPLRGLAEPAKMMMEYGNIDYDYKKVTSQEEWFAEKFNLGFDFPNLPYIIDGDVKLTESWAIYKYLGEKIKLAPNTKEEARQSDVLQGVISDIRLNFSMACYNADFYDLIEKLREKQDAKIAMVEKYLEDRKFLLGDKLSYLDFALYETFDHHRQFFTDIFDKSPNVRAYMDRFEALERVAEYFKSDRYSKFPINGSMATWGGQSCNDKK